jgi:hypothetical protein
MPVDVGLTHINVCGGVSYKFNDNIGSIGNIHFTAVI